MSDRGDMQWDPDLRPRLRPLEAYLPPDSEDGAVGVRDPSGLSEMDLILPAPMLYIMELMDGARTCAEICEKFLADVGQPLPVEALGSLLKHVEGAHFLEGPGFDTYYASLVNEYRSKPVREILPGSALEILDESEALFDEVFAEVERVDLPGPVVGLVAPHLDYPRGRPCYAQAYATLRERATPQRVVILGTNHGGQSPSVVATAKDFATPLGVTRTDTAFIKLLENRCGDLRTHELDHAREHSVELQVAWLQHLFGVDAFEMVPILCPDPCGPTGTAPYDGQGVDLGEFGSVLGELIAEDGKDTLIVAGADLSHTGAAFGDQRELEDGFLAEIRRRDEQALDRLVANDPSGWVRSVAEGGNPTRICGTGCIFALATALPHASATILGYHQAVDHPLKRCVTCAAVAFT